MEDIQPIQSSATEIPSPEPPILGEFTDEQYIAIHKDVEAVLIKHGLKIPTDGQNARTNEGFDQYILAIGKAITKGDKQGTQRNVMGKSTKEFQFKISQRLQEEVAAGTSHEILAALFGRL